MTARLFDFMLNMFNEKTCLILPMNRREASKAETRKLILNAAQNLFWEKGVEQCTMRGIAEKAGVSPASVVVHFKNKTALLEVALYEYIDKAIAKAMESPPKQDLLSRLMHIPEAMFSFYDSNRELYRSLMRHTVFVSEQESPYLTQQVNDYFEWMAGMLEKEKIRGNNKPNVDSMLAATSLFSLYFGVETAFFRNNEMAVETAVASLRGMTVQYLEGIQESSLK